LFGLQIANPISI
jgi:hypothetical protein